MSLRLPIWWCWTTTSTYTVTSIVTVTSTFTSTTMTTVTSTITATETFIPDADLRRSFFSPASHEHLLATLHPAVDTLTKLLTQALALYTLYFFWRWLSLIYDEALLEIDSQAKPVNNNKDNPAEPPEAPLPTPTLQAWLEPWLTIDWTVFYGLLTLSHALSWHTTPFRPYFSASIRERWYNHGPENCLARLLEKGVIPLCVQRGGSGVVRGGRWGLRASFLYIHVPFYTRTAKRAYFEFFVPYPEREEAKKFLKRLGRNEEGLAVTIRFREPQMDGSIAYFERRPVNLPGCKLPTSVGVRTPCKFLLPFLRDRVLEGSLGKKVRELQLFVEDGNVGLVPLMYNAKSALVRVEAGDYREADLDGWVWSVARESMPQTLWPRGWVEHAARVELRRQKLPVQGI